MLFCPHIQDVNFVIATSLFKQEVIDLVKHEGLSVDSQPGRCIGYRQTLEYLREVWKFPPESGEGNDPLAQVCVLPPQLSAQWYMVCFR